MPAARARVSAHARKTRRQDRIARAILWIAAGLTIGLLILIVGSIIYRGFYFDVRREYPVLARGLDTFALDGEGGFRIALIVHSGVRLRDLAMPDLIRLFNGAQADWELSGQNLGVRVFAQRPESELGGLFTRRVIGSKAAYAKATVFVAGDEEMRARVASTPGAVGYLSQEALSRVGRSGVKVVPVRSLSLVVNPEVLAVRDNLVLRLVTAEEVVTIFSGRIRGWKEVGGTRLPLQVVSFPASSCLGREFRETVFSGGEGIDPRALQVTDLEQLAAVLARTSGAVAFCPYLDAARLFEKSILSIQRREQGWNISLPFLLEPPAKAGKAGGVSTIILNTLFLIALTLLFSTPLGVGAALYLAEYARQGRLIRLLRFSTETLAGVPSIIFGLFGYIFFVALLKMGIGLISGTLTATLMVLPTIVRTAEEAFKAVPYSLREGSLALGATKWQTVTRIVVPAAAPGILTGVILAIGRTVGETAALLLTLGSSYRLAENLTSSARVLAVHLYILVKEGISFERAFATGLILMVMVLAVNLAIARLIGRRSFLRG